MDPKPVADLVHDRGGYLFLDAYQSAGVVPIDVEKQDVDMLATGTTKFMFGGPGIAFLYVDLDVANELEPATFGWFGSDDKFEAEDPDYAEGASRFQLGTPQITNTYQAGAGLSVLQEVGIDTVHDRVIERTSQIIEGARDRGFTVATPDADDQRTGIVTIEVEDHEATFERMGDEGYMTSFIVSQLVDSGIRLSPHFYTTAEEVEAALEALAANAAPA
jgi:selenocysteine lyase/cysteine desulfurase